MTIHSIPTAESPNGYEYQGHVFDSRGVTIRGTFQHQRYGCNWQVHYYDETTESRQENGGPILPGPYAFMIPLSTVITAHGATAAELARARTVINVQDGDVLLIQGRLFRIDDSRGRWGHDPKLVDVTHLLDTQPIGSAID